jgi:hypothetical protein
VSNVFNGLSDDEYGTSWGVFVYDPADGSYDLMAQTDRLQSNTGYWYANAGEEYTLRVTGRESRNRDLRLYSAPPMVGNLLGHASLDDVPWQDVRIVHEERILTLEEADPYLPDIGLACDHAPVPPTCLMSRKMYKWNGAAYQVFDGTTPGMQGSLSPFDGFGVAAYKSNLSLRIPKTNTAAEGDQPLTGGQQVEPHPREWNLRLTVTSGEQSDPGNLLGRLATARGGKDAHDLVELPPQGDSWLSLLFLNKAWEAEDNWGYTSDFRRAVRGEPRGSWRFVVKSSGEQREATLRWNSPRKVLKRARLIDTVNHKVIRLHRQDSYTFNLDGGEHRFRLVVQPLEENGK